MKSFYHQATLATVRPPRSLANGHEPNSTTMRSSQPSMPPLPRAVLERGITHMASAASVQRLMHRLQHGLPVSVGVLGASVGQLGGCLTQKGQRCMDTRFDQSTGLWHGGRNGYFAQVSVDRIRYAISRFIQVCCYKS